MEKLERSTKDFGGGSGRQIYESANFRVVIWRLQRGTETRINCEHLNGFENDFLVFEGSHDFTSDSDCIAQYELEEILQMIWRSKKEGIKEGRRQKTNEAAEAYTKWSKG